MSDRCSLLRSQMLGLFHSASDSLPADRSFESSEAARVVEAALDTLPPRQAGFVRVMMEEFCRTGLPFVSFDPVGILWGLRSKADGKGAGYPILVVGGPHQDLPMDRRSGAEVAKAIVESNVSAVIDFSDESKAVYRQFVGDFSDTLYRKNTHPRHVFIEEAPELVPQCLRPDMTQVFEAVERLVSRGRNRGIGVTLVSQRAATIHKDVLTQADHLVCFGLTSPQDRKALREWVEAKADPDKLAEFEAGLAGLARQEAWFWSPEQLDLFRSFRVAPMTTFHPDKTHLRRMGLLKVDPVSADVSSVIERLRPLLQLAASTAVKARSDGSKEAARLAAEIGRLRAEVAELRGDLERERRRSFVLPHGFKKAVQSAAAEMSLISDRIGAAGKRLDESLRAMLVPSEAADDKDRKAAGNGAAVAAKIAEPIHLRLEMDPDRVLAGAYRGSGASIVGTPRARILTALKELSLAGNTEPSKVTLALAAGYTPNTGTINTYFGAMRGDGVIRYGAGGGVALTEEGESELKASGKKLSALSQKDFLLRIERVLDGPYCRILKALYDNDTSSLPKDELSRRAGYEPNTGTVNTYYGRMRGLGLIDYEKRGGESHVILMPSVYANGGAI